MVVGFTGEAERVQLSGWDLPHHLSSETVLYFWAHGWISRTCLPGLAVEMQG